MSKDEYHAVAARAAANERSRRPEVSGDQQAQQRKPRADYLYRGRLRCGICDLRMTGSIRHRSGRRYYFCYPGKARATNIPEQHPPTIYLAEQPLHEAITTWLTYAIFGQDRLG